MTSARDLLVLEDGDLRVEALPAAGGRLHRIRVAGHDVLRTPSEVDEHLRRPFEWGAFPMVPWCNRVPGGRIPFAGRVVQVPMNVEGHAIHGLAADRPWSVDDDGLGVSISGGDELPWPWSARQRYRLSADGAFELELSVRNDGDEPMPAGVGLHPWFAAGGGLEVRVPAGEVYPQRDNVPTADPVPVDGRLDLRTLGTPAWGLDDVLTGLTGQRVELVWPGVRCELTFSPTADHVVVASFEAMGAVAVEPQTHATDGHRRRAAGERGGIDVLAGGESLAVTYRFRFSRR